MRGSHDLSTAAADALDLGVQQLFTFIRRRLDVAVVAAAMPAGEFGSVRSAPAKSVAARIGWGRQDCQKCRGQEDRHRDSGSCHARVLQQVGSPDHANQGEIRAGGPLC
jgi:hypothetical protein